MRVFIITILLFSAIFADNNFWNELNEGKELLFEETLDDTNQSIVVTQQTSNSLLNVDKENLSLVEKKIYFYDSIIFKLKNSPSEINSPSTAFYDKDSSVKRRIILENQKKVNIKNKNNLAIERDSLEIENLVLNERIFRFIEQMASDFSKLNLEAIKSTIEAEKKNLKYIDIDYFNDVLESINEEDNNVANQIKENYKTFKNTYEFYSGLIEYLDVNFKVIFVEKSIINFLALNHLISLINSISIISEVNVYLKYIYTDGGRLFLFFIILGFFWTLKTVSDKFIIPNLKKLLDTPQEDAYDIILLNFENLRKPVTFIVRLFGLDLALKILFYPKDTPLWIDNIFYLIYILNIAWLLIVLIDVFVGIFLESKYKTKQIELRKELINLIIKISKIIVFLVALLLFLNKIGINITGFIASLGIGGLAIALAAKDTLSNFFGSLKIIFEESFSQGDWIAVGEVEGNVVELGFGSTKIRTFDNALISVPNSVLSSQSIKNWNKRTIGRRIKMHIGVTYNSNKDDIQKAVTQIREMLENNPHIANEIKTKFNDQIEYDQRESKLIKIDDKYGIKKTILVYLDQFSPYSIDILIYAFSNSVVWAEWLKVKEDIMYKIWKILEDNNLEFAFPTQTLYHKKEDKIEELNIK